MATENQQARINAVIEVKIGFSAAKTQADQWCRGFSAAKTQADQWCRGFSAAKNNQKLLLFLFLMSARSAVTLQNLNNMEFEPDKCRINFHKVVYGREWTSSRTKKDDFITNIISKVILYHAFMRVYLYKVHEKTEKSMQFDDFWLRKNELAG